MLVSELFCEAGLQLMLGELESKHTCLWQGNSAISRGVRG